MMVDPMKVAELAELINAGEEDLAKAQDDWDAANLRLHDSMNHLRMLREQAAKIFGVTP